MIDAHRGIARAVIRSALVELNDPRDDIRAIARALFAPQASDLLEWWCAVGDVDPHALRRAVARRAS